MFRWHRSSQVLGFVFLLSVVGFSVVLAMVVFARLLMGDELTLKVSSPVYVNLDRCIGAITFILLSVGIVSGLSTLHTHQRYFSKFHLCDVLQLRLDAWLYIVVMLSTSLTFGNAVLHVYGYSESGVAYAEAVVPYLVDCLNCAGIALVVCLHMVVNALLANDQICKICQSTWDDHGKN